MRQGLAFSQELIGGVSSPWLVATVSNPTLICVKELCHRRRGWKSEALCSSVAISACYSVAVTPTLK